MTKKDEKLKKNGEQSKQGEGGGRPRAFPDINILNEKIDLYFKKYEQEKRPVTMLSLAVFLDVSQKTLCEYISGRYDTKDQRFSQSLEKAKSKIAASLAEGGLLSDYNANITKFILSVNHGMNERHEFTGKDGEPLSPPAPSSLIIDHKLSATEAAKIYRSVVKGEK